MKSLILMEMMMLMEMMIRERMLAAVAHFRNLKCSRRIFVVRY